MVFKVSSVAVFLATLIFSNTISPSSSQNDVEWYCATECLTDDADPCGDRAGQRATCTTLSSMEKANLGYGANDTLPPGGFLGCSRSSCAGFCSSSSSSSIVNNGSVRVLETTNRRLFCFDGTTTMFGNRDHAEMSAISRGCEGSHAMGSNNYMHGSGHGTCGASSYRENGVPYNDTTLFVDGRDGEWSNRIPYGCITAGVGDELVFRVTPNHDLYRLSGLAAYADCDFTGATLVANVGAGEVSVPLDAGGDYYFACSIGEHCSNDHSGHDHDHDHDHGGDDMLYAQKVYVSVGGDDGVSCEDAMMAAQEEEEEESSSPAESSSATSSNNRAGILRVMFAVLFALI